MTEKSARNGRPQVRRYHGLDGLRGFAMLLGIVLHATLPYFSRLYEFESTWPADDDQSVLLALVFDFIHMWRMPVFFLLAGFFAHLVLDRRSTATFVIDRLKRIALPLALFGAVMAVIIPPIWLYGWSGSFSLETFRGVLADRQDLDSSGDLIGHLWFLNYLLLMYAALVALRALAGPCRLLRVVQPAWWLSTGRLLGDAVYARMPLLLALGAVPLLVLRAGDEAKPIWPLNLPDVLYGALFFFYGYGLYARRELVDRLRGDGALAALLSIPVVTYFVHLVLLGVIDGIVEFGRKCRVDRIREAARHCLLRLLSGLVQRRFRRPLRAGAYVARPVGPLAGGLVVLGIHLASAGRDIPDVLPRPPRPAGLAEIPDGLQLERRGEVPGSLRCDRRPGAGDVPLPRQIHPPRNPPERQEGGGWSGLGHLGAFKVTVVFRPTC